jgi:hypothetical protein
MFNQKKVLKGSRNAGCPKAVASNPKRGVETVSLANGRAKPQYRRVVKDGRNPQKVGPQQAQTTRAPVAACPVEGLKATPLIREKRSSVKSLPKQNSMVLESRRADELKPSKMTFHRAHRVTERQLAAISDRFPQVDFQFGNGPPHDHPLGATERAVCETLALQEIERQFGTVRVTDIGGNPKRHADNRRTNVHSCTPTLTSDDVVRRFKCSKDMHCSSNVMDCNYPVDVYLSVHSLYYLTQQQILELVHRSSRGCLFAVVHMFDMLYGTMHDNGDFVESKYEAYSEGMQVKVRMQVNGNLTTYEHDPCLWLKETFYRDGKRAIAWNGQKFGDSWILQFVKVPAASVGNITADHAAEMSLVSSLSRNDHYGPVHGVLSHGDESKYKPMLQFMKLDGSKIRSFMGHLYLQREEQVVLLPKGVIQQVAIKMVGCPRDTAGLKLCINTMRNLVNSSKMSMSNDMRLNCVIYGSAMAFILTLEDEISAFNSVCTKYNMSLFQRLFGILHFEHWTRWWCCGGEVDHILTPYGSRTSGPRNAGFFEVSREYRDFHLTKEMYDRNLSSIPSDHPFDAAKAWPKGLPGYESNKELRPVRQGATVTRIDRTEVLDKPEFFPVAMTLQNYIPLVPHASLNNESVAIVNRALMEVPKAEDSAWDEFDATAEEFIEKFEPISNHHVDKDFKDWNMRFGKTRAAEQAKAWESLQSEPLNEKDLMRKAMAKRELTMKGGESPEEFDPRAIQGGTHRLNAAYGPFMHKVADQMHEIFGLPKDFTGEHIVYTGGLTSEEIGSIRAFFGNEDVTLIWEDESRYDCHQERRAYKAWRKVEKKCNIGEYGQANAGAKSMKKVYGYTHKGVKYSVAFTMTSGSPSTSSRNSYINAVKTINRLRAAGFKDYIVLVHGDDNLIVLRGHFSIDRINAFKDDVITFNKRLGFETKFGWSQHWSDAEYCSSLFWPVEDGFVLGPKIGKRMPKIGFSLKQLKPGEVKGMLLGCNIECGYVPVLGSFVRHQLRLMTKVGRLDYHDDRRVYKSLPNSRHDCNDDTRQFFFDRYGITVDEAEASLARAMTRNLTDSIDYPCFSHFQARDLE